MGADLQTSRAYLEQAADRFVEAGLPGEAAGSLLMLARRLPVSAKHVFDLDLAERAMALGRQSGDYCLQAVANKHLAIAYMNQGRDEQALALAEASLRMQRDVGDRHEECSTLDVMGVILSRLGRREAAAAAFQRCLEIAEEIGSDWGILGAVFGFWNYGYVPDGEYEQLCAFIDERLRYTLVNERAWLDGFLRWLKTRAIAAMGQYDEALSWTQTAAYQATQATEADLVGRACVMQLAGSVKGTLGYYDQARQDLETALALTEQTADPYMISLPLVDLAELALCEGGQERLRQGLAGARTAVETALDVGEEGQWAAALDVSARLYLALGLPDNAYEDSSQAMRLLQSCPWLPRPQAHLHTHYLVLCALGRTAEAKDYLVRAHARVLFVADTFTDDALRQGWLQHVGVNREILHHWQEIRTA